MPLVQRVKTIRTPFNQGIAGLTQQLQAWLSAQAAISIRSVDYVEPDINWSGAEARLRIGYAELSAPAVGRKWEARLYQTDSASTADQKINLDLGAGAFVVPWFVIDIAPRDRRTLDVDSLLLIAPGTSGTSASNGSTGLVGYERAAFIAQASADVAAGAAGNAVLFDSRGIQVCAAVSVRNLGAVAWNTGQRTYAVMDPVTGEYVALPPCSGAGALPAPTAPTTTPYPCPAFLAQTPPVTPVPTT